MTAVEPLLPWLRNEGRSEGRHVVNEDNYIEHTERAMTTHLDDLFWSALWAARKGKVGAREWI